MRENVAAIRDKVAAAAAPARAPAPVERRKPVAMGRGEGNSLIVMCDDGSLWRYDEGFGGTEMPPVPGSQRDAELEDQADVE